MEGKNRRIELVELPQDRLTEACFRLTEGPVPEPGEGEVLCRTRYLSIDAANRAWMQGATYRSALEAGQVMAGGVLAEVVASRADGFAPGDLVEGDGGWQDYFVAQPRHLTKRTPHEPLSHLLSVLGITGKTAYCGLRFVGEPEAGETVLVSAAAGATGSVAGQIARILGCRVVGVVGDDAKGRMLVDELGFDAFVNRREGNLHRSLKAACPDGVDVYFDNTGGDILEAALFRMNQGGRIVCCGAVSQYDTGTPQPGPRGVPGLLVTKRLRMQGFIVMDFAERLTEAEADLSKWAADGSLVVLEDVIEGLENAPAALIGLLAGENRGKRMVKVSA